jgi:DNA polymerase-4
MNTKMIIPKFMSKRECEISVKTLGELKNKLALLSSYSKMSRNLYKRICGTDNERVISYSDRRSIGISRNFKAISCRNDI